jgi:serine/threonine protein kinase
MLELVTPLPEGHKLFEYRFLRLLGQGGFGTTYLCHDEHLQKQCVVKEFTPHALVVRRPGGDLKALRWGWRKIFAIARADFLSEARKLAKFSHPNIVRVNRYFEAHNTAYFVMDHEAGGSLRSLLRNRPSAFTETEIEALILPLCNGLAELHRIGLIHRDIKPENIIIRPDGSPALIDFGAAVEFRSLRGADFEIAGTPAYAPIEQFDPNTPQGPWTDIYALGAVMYELIAGHFPTPSLKRVQGAEMQAASSVGRGKYGDRLLGLIDKCLAMNFVERPKGTGEFLVLLQANKDYLLREVIHDTSLKMVGHLSNWAKPNDGLYLDEFIAFVICFPIIDLSWRIGKGTPDKATFVRLYKLMDQNSLRLCWDLITQKGFKAARRNLTLELIHARLDEYAATYLLDRQQSEWRYEMTCKQVARNCIAASHAGDATAFAVLMEDVVDRARARVKNEFNKAFRNVIWRKTPAGWVQEIVRFDGTD